MRKAGIGAVLFAALVLLSFSAAPAQTTETVTVTGQHAMRVGSYKGIHWVYDRFDRLPERARKDLSLHFLGDILPDHGVPSEAHVVLHAKGGDIPLFVGQDRDMHFPRSDALLAENPPVLLTLSPDRKVQLELAIEVAPLPTPSFTKEQAGVWMGEINAAIRDFFGVILAFLAPDAHRLKVDVAPGARFEAVENGTTRLLVDNQGSVPYTFILRPQDYQDGTVFRSDRPFSMIRVKVPTNEFFTLKRKK
ncbi:hypothetical protein [Gluconobacter oxydans]|uniref:DUF2987 family protein n=1 Tax=Gluconobacter oxydans DSM 3504 TaxID=1288313 RepID=A0A067Z4M7_GLUOY|nr:hypothetical protein [Gluconobacter oxydans]AHK72021.1 hypothetical protein GLS_c21500 [Gluconobacter oxydans DSM 3504]